MALLSTLPAQGAYAVTPSDSAALAKTVRGLYVGVTGNVAVTGLDGLNCTFTNVPVGILQVACSYVLSTGTTASGIVGLL